MERIEDKLDRVIDFLERNAGARDLVAKSHDKFWALEGLRDRLEDGAGTVMIVGAVGLRQAKHTTGSKQSRCPRPCKSSGLIQRTLSAL